MSHSWIKVVVVPLALGAAGLAFGEDSIESTRAAAPGYETGRFSAEIKPLPTVLSVIPGVGGLGLGAEAMVSRDTAVYAESTFLDSNLSGRTESEARDRAGSNLYPNKARAVNVDLGGRFYTSPMSSSWYGGAKLGYSTLHSQWFYHDATIDQKTASLTPGINAGYRWKWDNSMLVRLGAGAAANFVQFERTERNDDSADGLEAQKKLDDKAHTPILANLDLGVGYVF